MRAALVRKIYNAQFFGSAQLTRIESDNLKKKSPVK